MKTSLLKDLYDCFYIPPDLAEQNREVEECHHSLIKVLNKPERRLVLKIIDAKDRIVEDTSIDSFISGFELAWHLSMELNHHKKDYPVSHKSKCSDAFSASEQICFVQSSQEF